MTFEEAYEGWQERRLTQEEADSELESGTQPIYDLVSGAYAGNTVNVQLHRITYSPC